MANNLTARLLLAATLAAAVAAVTLLDAPVKAEQAARPIETCSGRVTAFVGTGELIPKGVRMLHVSNDGEDCAFFVTERRSINGKRIVQTCPIGSNCRIEARLWGGDGGIHTIISVTRIKPSPGISYPAEMLGTWCQVNVESGWALYERGKCHGAVGSIVLSPNGDYVRYTTLPPAVPVEERCTAVSESLHHGWMDYNCVIGTLKVKEKRYHKWLLEDGSGKLGLSNAKWAE